MYLNSETIKIQNDLADYCRSGELLNLKGVDENRVANYRRLIFNNIKNSLEQAFPLTVKWLSEEEWSLLVNSFVKYHNVKTPKIWEMPKEFLEYVKKHNFINLFNKPALYDLLLLEWIEIEVYSMPDIEVEDYKTKGDVIKDRLVLNPEYRIVQLNYPVHLITAEEAESKKGIWFVYVFRNRDSGNVGFLNISALHVFLLNKLIEKEQTIESIIPLISEHFGLDSEISLKHHLEKFIKDLFEKKAVVGFRS